MRLSKRKETRRAIRKLITKEGLQVLLSTFGLSGGHNADDDDAVLIAIDFENHAGNLSTTQVGLALLDTKRLNENDRGSIITTYNFVIGDLYYCEKASKKFLFEQTTATTIVASKNGLRAKIEACIPTNRRVILAGHHIYNDLAALKRLGFDFQAFQLSIIDTELIARTETSPFVSLSLPKLVNTLGFSCDQNWHHCAGNDACFTLRAALLLAARAPCEGKRQKKKQQILAEIATSPIPRQLQKAAKEKRRRHEDSSTLSEWDIANGEKLATKRLKRRLELSQIDIIDSILCFEELLLLQNGGLSSSQNTGIQVVGTIGPTEQDVGLEAGLDLVRDLFGCGD